MLTREADPQYQKVGRFAFEHCDAIDRIVIRFYPGDGATKALGMGRRFILNQPVRLLDQLIFRIRGKLVVASPTEQLDYVLYESLVSREDASDHLSNFKSPGCGSIDVVRFDDRPVKLCRKPFISPDLLG